MNPAWMLRFEPPAQLQFGSRPAEELFLRLQSLPAAAAAMPGYELAYLTRCEQLKPTCGKPLLFETRWCVQYGVGSSDLHGVPVCAVHDVWGVPVLRAEGIKWTCRAEAEAALKDRKSLLAEAFGSLMRRERGALVFHDAWWVPPAQCVGQHGPFKHERNTPEMQGKPNPVPRLAARGVFAFWLGVTREAGEAETWRGAAVELLQRALQDRGLGAELNVDDYGRFRPYEC